MPALYRKIARSLIDLIKQHELNVGDKIPTEARLMKQYKASRNTVRESLRELEMLGYTRRRRGTRSVVIEKKPEEKFVNSVQSVHELLRYPIHTISRFINQESVVANKDLAGRLQTEEGTLWQKIEVLRQSVELETPIGYSEIYIQDKYSIDSEKYNLENPIYLQLEDMYNFSFKTIRQTLTAEVSDANISSRLNIPVESVIMKTRTEFIAAEGDIIEIGFGHFRADRFSVESVLERGLNHRTNLEFMEQVDEKR
ncbi:MAG: GntR family transcriptional regulator [Porticoccaceae bacterium]|nr:GntR family transcriptional regulator [Porticoccaceae bacterium]